MADAKAIITQAAQKYGVDPKILWGLYGTETSFGKDVSTSSAGAVGPFQFEPATAKSMGVNPYDFKSAAYGAARYLAQYKGRGVGGMLSAYNAGPAGNYQAGYVNTTLANAKTFDGSSPAPVPTSRSAGQEPAPNGSSGSSGGSYFDTAGFLQANRRAILGRLIASEEGTKGNPLFASGLLSTKAPQRSEYETAGGEGGAVGGRSGPVNLPSGGPAVAPSPLAVGNGPPAVAGLKPVAPPVKVKLPGYITGEGYPKVEQAKHALERAEGHHVSVPELRKQVDQGAAAPHAQVIAQHPQGNVLRTDKGPVFMPHKRSGR